MNEFVKEGSREGLPCKSVPNFGTDDKRELEPDRKDRIFAVWYLLLGYGFVCILNDGFWNGQWNSFRAKVALFSIVYVATVLVYLGLKGIKPARESYFWVIILLALGIPFAFWSVLYFLQFAALIVTAAYWTISAVGGLAEKKTSEWILWDLWNTMIWIPFKNITGQIRILLEHETRGRKGKASVCLGMVIVFPLLCVILPILSNADAGFEKLMWVIAGYANEEFWDQLIQIIVRLLFALPISAYLFGMLYGGIRNRDVQGTSREMIWEAGKELHRIPAVSIYTVLIVISAVYVLFIGIQGRYLFSAFQGALPGEYTYAEYARRGFFELCGIGVWNLLILGAANAFASLKEEKDKVLGWLNILLSVLTLLLIATAMSKMGMYMTIYGLTVKRILTMTFMVWLVVVFVLVIIYQHKKIQAVRFGVIAGAVLFALLCVVPVQGLTHSFNQKYGFESFEQDFR